MQKTIQLLLGAAALACGFPAFAVPVTWTFEGNAPTEQCRVAVLSDRSLCGQTFSGFLTYESDNVVPDVNAVSKDGPYGGHIDMSGGTSAQSKSVTIAWSQYGDVAAQAHSDAFFGFTLRNPNRESLFDAFNPPPMPPYESYTSFEWLIEFMYGGEMWSALFVKPDWFSVHRAPSMIAVPEPSALSLLGASFGVLALVRYRRKRGA